MPLGDVTERAHLKVVFVLLAPYDTEPRTVLGLGNGKDSEGEVVQSRFWRDARALPRHPLVVRAVQVGLLRCGCAQAGSRMFDVRTTDSQPPSSSLSARTDAAV